MDRLNHKITIGRDAARDIPLGDDSVSAHHAELNIGEDGRLWLTDCQSTNGTFVIDADGSARRIHQTVVAPGDRVRFGTVTLAVSALLEVRGLSAVPRTPQKTPAPPMSGRRLVRCQCGCIKPEGTRCGECGR